MKRKRKIKPILYIVIPCLLLIFTFGCDKYARHKVLTFFFTGVPPVDSMEQPQTNSAAPTRSARSRALTFEEQREARMQAERKNIKKQIVPSYIHGPYASNQCNMCHSTASSATFRTGLKEESGISGNLMGGVSARLVMPDNELCIDCHTEKSVDTAFNMRMWVHGPVSKGICMSCHDPHQSRYKYMLTDGNSRDMCTKCHARGFITETEDHLKDEECTSCHNPHIGKNRFLLKKDFDETL